MRKFHCGHSIRFGSVWLHLVHAGDISSECKSRVWFQGCGETWLDQLGPVYTSLACSALPPELITLSILRSQALPRPTHLCAEERWGAVDPGSLLVPVLGILLVWGSARSAAGWRGTREWCSSWLGCGWAPTAVPHSGQFPEQSQGSEHSPDNKPAVPAAAALLLQRALRFFISLFSGFMSSGLVACFAFSYSFMRQTYSL